MKFFLACVSLFLFSGAAFAQPNPKTYQYTVVANANYPSDAGQAIGTLNFSGCSVSTTFTSGSADLEVQLKNTGGTFTSLTGGPIAGAAFKFFDAPFTHFRINSTNCSSCNATVTITCGIE